MSLAESRAETPAIGVPQPLIDGPQKVMGRALYSADFQAADMAVGRVLRAVRLSPAVDVFDRVIAQYRSRLGRFVPDGPAPRRYP